MGVRSLICIERSEYIHLFVCLLNILYLFLHFKIPKQKSEVIAGACRGAINHYLQLRRVIWTDVALLGTFPQYFCGEVRQLCFEHFVVRKTLRCAWSF